MIKSIKLFIMLLGSMAFAQTAQVSGTINLVKEDGLYRIRIPHNVRSYATQDLRDIRVWDAMGNQVPYFVQPASDYKLTKVSDFTEFEIVSNTRIADSNAIYIFKNPYETIEKAVLLIANYQGSKNYSLEGSNDQKEWFGLVNNGQLTQLNHPTETSVYKEIYFPVIDYPYLKLVFDDRHSLPINLLGIGMANTETINIVPITMEEVPVKSIAFLEQGKKTQIHICFDRPEVIDQLRMTITSPDLYRRNALLYTLKEREVKRSVETYRQHLAAFSIRSDKDLIFNIPTSREQDLYLEIDNKDNPKLEISKLQFLQEPVYLVASLKANDSYKVTAGDDQLEFPDYDIIEVTNTTKTALPIAEIGAVVYGQPEKADEKTKSFWQQPWFMWSCIGIAALMIVYFAFNMLRDMNTSESE
ncbi:DUF3999 family protein [Gelidibacter japonicus]|uniref:DUF3999 family protein n=1 Tax=Gelidibacter japonicus TaxID=1962232 RepID=UPI003A914A60